jgi:hypothetical protein
MKIIKILIPTVTILLLLGAAATALASQTTTSYSFGAIEIGIPNTGNTWTSADKILHKVNGESLSYSFGYPWGSGVGTGDLATPHWNLNVDPTSKNYLTGNGHRYFEKTFASGTLDLTSSYKFEGLVTSFTYEGPTFTVTLPAPYGILTITNGQVFNGAFLAYTGQAKGHGTFLNGNVRVSESITGCNVLAGPLAGLNIIMGTGTATTTG